MKNIISIFATVLFFVNNAFGQFNLTTDTKPKETHSNKGKPINVSDQLGDLYLDIVTLPETGNKEYLQVQVVNRLFGGKDIESIVVSVIPTADIINFECEKGDYSLMLKVSKKKSKKITKTQIINDFGAYDKCNVPFGASNEASIKPFIQEKLIPSLQKEQDKQNAESIVNKFCNRFDIKLGGAEKDLPYNNTSARVFKSFGNNIVSNDGLPHYSTYGSVEGLKGYIEYYYVFKDKYFEVTEYYADEKKTITGAKRSIYYYEDITNVEVLACDASHKNCDKSLKFGYKKGFFRYEYYTDRYELNQFSHFGVFNTFSRFGVAQFAEKLKDKAFDASTELEENPTKLKPLGKSKVLFDNANPNGKIIQGEASTTTKLSKEDKLKNEENVIEINGQTFYMDASAVYNSNFEKIGSRSAVGVEFNERKTIYLIYEDGIKKNGKLIHYAKRGNASLFYDKDCKSPYLTQTDIQSKQFDILKNGKKIGKCKIASFKRVELREIACIIDYLGL